MHSGLRGDDAIGHVGADVACAIHALDNILEKPCTPRLTVAIEPRRKPLLHTVGVWSQADETYNIE